MYEENTWKVLNVLTGDESLFVTELEALAHYKHMHEFGTAVLRVERVTVVARITHGQEYASTPEWSL